VLQAYAQICPEARRVVEDARAAMDKGDTRLSAELNRVACAINDAVMTQAEATAAGLRMFSEDLARKEGARAAAAGATPPPRLDFEARISEEPLPVAWGVAIPDGPRARKGTRDRIAGMRERWSYEIRELKRMGFEDESDIIRALKEAAGNVQRAVKLLRRHQPNGCE
jgi:hypothetical protein